MGIQPDCPICRGYGLVCESHPFSPWSTDLPEGCECSPGMACICSPNHDLPPEAKVLLSVSDSSNQRNSP